MLQLEQYFNDEKVVLLKIPALFLFFSLFVFFLLCIGSQSQVICRQEGIRQMFG